MLAASRKPLAKSYFQTADAMAFLSSSRMPEIAVHKKP
jgi:hypothetical protein